MAIADVVVQLQAIGIEVREAAQSQRGGASVQIVIPAELHTNEDGRREHRTAVTYEIVQQRGGWVFEGWDCAPGPCLDDFTATFATREEAIDAVARYAIGGPTIFRSDGWSRSQRRRAAAARS